METCINFRFFFVSIAEEEEEVKDDIATAEMSGDSDENLAKIAANVNKVKLFLT